MEKKLIVWDRNYSVGYDEIDMQHQKLIDILNELFEAKLNGKEDNVIGELLEKLYEYTDYHFAEEEIKFMRADYARKNEHIKLHKDFLKKIKEFKRDLVNGATDVADKVFQFLKDWLINHILFEDKGYRGKLG